MRGTDESSTACWSRSRSRDFHLGPFGQVICSDSALPRTSDGPTVYPSAICKKVFLLPQRAVVWGPSGICLPVTVPAGGLSTHSGPTLPDGPAGPSTGRGSAFEPGQVERPPVWLEGAPLKLGLRLIIKHLKGPGPSQLVGQQARSGRARGLGVHVLLLNTEAPSLGPHDARRSCPRSHRTALRYVGSPGKGGGARKEMSYTDSISRSSS